jgi:hypothetical protein
MLENYYKPFYLQELRGFSTGFQPPFEKEFIFGDGKEIKGMFKQSQSTEQLIASASGIKTHGRFACSPAENLLSGDVLRNNEGLFIRIVGDPLVAPEQSTVQVKTYEAYITDRTSEERVARQFAGISDYHGKAVGTA